MKTRVEPPILVVALRIQCIGANPIGHRREVEFAIVACVATIILDIYIFLSMNKHKTHASNQGVWREPRGRERFSKIFGLDLDGFQDSLKRGCRMLTSSPVLTSRSERVQ
jgi:hypothetical protein